MKIKKALLLVGGRGTRVMPLTLHQPKGMIALADKPMVHYAIDELVASGLNEIIIVHGPDQEVFKHYINHLKMDHEWNSHVKFLFICQEKQRGDGDAVVAAKKFIKRNESFVVAFCDDIFGEKKSSLKQMTAHFSKTGLPTILCTEVPHNEVNKYGVIQLGDKNKNGFYTITDLVEKPTINKAPSNLIACGRYVLPYKMISYLEKLYSGDYSEIRLAYALKLFIDDHKKIWGFTNPRSIRFDCGSKKGLIHAQAYFSFNHPQVKKELKNLLI
mgnify:CR=1 FL=1